MIAIQHQGAFVTVPGNARSIYRMRLDLEPLYQRFAEHREMIGRRLSEDPMFREMCEDFIEVHNMMLEARDSPSHVDREHVQEYEDLLGELGLEIMHELHGYSLGARAKEDVGRVSGSGERSVSES